MTVARPRTDLWSLSVHQHIDEDVVVVSLRGRVGKVTGGTLAAALTSAIETSHQHVVVELTQVDYISSPGLLALEAAAAQLERRGRRLLLCGLSEPVRLALDVAGLLPHLAIEPTLADAKIRSRAL
jgi:stage II sporulation protein AA (anti-sigma F factor antagonist)